MGETPPTPPVDLYTLYLFRGAKCKICSLVACMLPEKPAAGCHPVVRIGGLLTTYVHICMYNYDTCMYLVIEGGSATAAVPIKFFFFKSARLFGTMYSTSLSMQWTGLPLRQPWAIYQHIGPVQFCLSLKIRIAL